MTPQEQAQRIFMLFYDSVHDDLINMLGHTEAKQCALICADEMLQVHVQQITHFHPDAIRVMEDAKVYWRTVKDEIEKL